MTDWRSRAACLDEDPELFFPVGENDSGPTGAQVEAARKVCFGCPVRLDCLSWALDTVQMHGVWGGSTPQDRRDMLPRRSSAPKEVRSRKGKPTELTADETKLILDQLDAGARPVEVAAALRIGEHVCRRVWREHRQAPNPPGPAVIA